MKEITEASASVGLLLTTAVINVLISRNDALFKDIKISLGLLITAKK